MSTKIKINKTFVDKADTPTDKDQVFYRDAELKGFALRVTASGTKSFVVEKNINEPVNIGSGIGVSIKYITAELQKIKPGLQIEWDISKPKGDNVRILDMSRLKKYGFASSISIEDGLKDTYQWYEVNKNSSFKRYDAFNE